MYRELNCMDKNVSIRHSGLFGRFCGRLIYGEKLAFTDLYSISLKAGKQFWTLGYFLEDTRDLTLFKHFLKVFIRRRDQKIKQYTEFLMKLLIEGCITETGFFQAEVLKSFGIFVMKLSKSLFLFWILFHTIRHKSIVVTSPE